MFDQAPYPHTRLRRLRSDGSIRALLDETQISVNDLIWPVFIKQGLNHKEAIAAMPGQYRHGLDDIDDIAKKAQDLGIKAVALFPVIAEGLKDRKGSESANPDNIICQAIRRMKDKAPDLMIICDVALDPFNSDGHDGLYYEDDRQGGIIDNDKTIEALIHQALVQADAGCDTLAPSDMMDGRIGAIRKALDEKGFSHVRLLSYAVKYASCFYGPFRDAVDSGQFLKGDKKSYQMSPQNRHQAFQEVALDLSEGADIVMVKPAMAYLDIIRDLASTIHAPLFAYQVSGEYAMIKLAADAGYIDEKAAMIESLTAIKRAGANAIFTYFAPDMARHLQNK